MHPRLRGSLTVALGSLLAAGVHADPGAVALRAATVRPAAPSEARGLERGAPWQGFLARHGHWSASWNAVTASPHRASGPPVALAGLARDSASVDRAVRAFVRGERALLGDPPLETAAILERGGVWYVRYRQTFHGVPMAFTDWEFRVGPHGLMAFGADVRAIPEATPTTPLLVPAAAREAARAGLGFDPNRDATSGGDRLWLVPWSEGAFRLAAEVEVRIAAPPARWRTLVDARSGEILWRHDLVRTVVSGSITGQVHLALPTDPLTTVPFANENVSVDGGTVTSDASGLYAGAASGQAKVLSSLSGPFCVVDRPGNGDAVFNVTVQDPSTVNIAWTGLNSLDSERDGWHHVNAAHQYVKALDPGLTQMDYAMPCHVEVTGDVCNAFYDGAGVNFYAAGGGCPSMATLADVVDHEYGHGVNDHVYRQAGVSGMFNDALHEGMADVFSALLMDDPSIGDGVMGPGTSWRSLANAFRWPQDRSGDPHVTGLIVGGAFWSLRQSLGLTLATRLSHFMKYGTPDDPDDGVAMSETFLETLIADDDDGNLANGTPHFSQINAAFDAHGIGSGSFLGISHVPLADVVAPGPRIVSAHVTWTGPFGGLAGAPTLRYSVDGLPYTGVAMTPAGPPGDYTASLPGSTGTLVRYYLEASDASGGTRTDPPSAPAWNVHAFLTGAVTPVLVHDQENDQGWIVGAPGDAATTGIWVRAEPVGTVVGAIQVQPELDHTPDPGSLCFVTGSAAPRDPVGTADVDGGATTLRTPVFSALGAGNPVIEYWRWFSNNGGLDAGVETWRVDLSNDAGAHWTPVESTTGTDPSWRRVLVRIADVLPPTSAMQMRFVASDFGAASLVEAAVDDLRLLSLPATTGVASLVAPPALDLSPPWPNPSSGAATLRYALPRAGRVSLTILDLQGRPVRRIDAGWRAAGPGVATWDGRDQAGRPAASGAYFARLTLDGSSRVRRLVHLR